MKWQTVKGMRDFYPEDMAVRNRIMDAWRRVSERNGFLEYDGPILEHLDLYTAKSGEGIVEELFHLEDRGGRKLAIRPEMTPTLARMINARAQTLPRPIKWYSTPRLCRAERPQRGRLREFFQWNLDIVGEDGLVADAECIFAAVDFFREVGLTPTDMVMRINSRSLMSALLEEMGVPGDRMGQAFALLDRAEKTDPEKFGAMWEEGMGGFLAFDRLKGLLAVGRVEDVPAAMGLEAPDRVRQEVDRVRELFTLLHNFGISEYCEYNVHVIRGLAYYTGPVFEAFGCGGLRRAICGGGRYDDLLRALGGPSLSGVGFGTSDVVIGDLLAELGRLPAKEDRIEVFVIDAAPGCFERVVQAVSALRGSGVSAEFSYRRLAVGKQMKSASQRGARWAVLIGEETVGRGVVTIKNLADGVQRECGWNVLLCSPKTILCDGGGGGL